MMGYDVLSGDSGKMGHTLLSTTLISTGIVSLQIVVTDNLLFEGQFVGAYVFQFVLEIPLALVGGTMAWVCTMSFTSYGL